MEKNYSVNEKNKIESIEKDSIAEELGIEVGDRVISINGKKIDDIIDYIFLLADEYVEVEIEKKNSEIWVLEIEKDYYEELGIEFENPIMDKAKSCSNKCVFCFIDQLAPNMRETLYFKDDDSRLSFLQGNFITLTNLKKRELERIVEYKISPLNVSIHTTNPELRKKMLNNRFAGDVLEKIKYLAENGIEVNGQIVLCPGYNDKEELDRTLDDLFELNPLISSIAVVPVGITKFRDGLAKLDIFTEETAFSAVTQMEEKQKKFLEKSGTRFAFISDEFYMIANKELPKYEDYEGFIQLENGVGLMRKFERELEDAIKKSDYEKLNSGNSITILTGTSAYEFMIEMVDKVKNVYKNIDINVIKIYNEFFGRTITVAGLITATDIIEQIVDKDIKENIMIPEVMLRTGEEIFLDDITLDGLKDRIKKNVIVTKVEGKEFLDNIFRR